MKKNRRLLNSLICLIGSATSLTMVLSSCVSSSDDDKNQGDSDDSIVTPPNDDDNNDNIEKPSEPETSPDDETNKPGIDVVPPTEQEKPTPSEPSAPENKPESTPPSNLISKDSINLKDYSNLLPSQYLLDLNNLENLSLDVTKIIKNFNETKVSDVKYTVLSLSDWTGSLSIKMEYKNKSDNKMYEFIFNFTNLAKLENQNYNLSFDTKNKSLLNAKEISSKLINNDNDSKRFFEYLSQNGTSLIFKNGVNKLPIKYLDFEGGISVSGFQDIWYKSNKDIELNVSPMLLKLNVYEKNKKSNVINVKKHSYPINLIGSVRNPIKLTCSSALDYLLEKITVNKSNKENKFASYYYYDIIEDNGTETQLKLTNDRWLKNVENSIDGYDQAKYKPTISKINNPNIDQYGNLTIQIQMQLNDDEVFSRETKELTIESFLPMNEDIFFYNGSKNNKFNLFCEANEQDEIIKIIKQNKQFLNIKNEINNSNENIVDVSKYFNKLDHTKFKNKIKLYFGNSSIQQGHNHNYYTSADSSISIKNYIIDYYDNSNVIIQYDKTSNCFQAKFVLYIDCHGLDINHSTSDEMTVNITKINTPLE